MSTLEDEINRHIASSRLIVVDYDPQVRDLLVSQVINQILSADDELATDVVADMHRFARGDRMRVRRPDLDADGDEQSDMVRLKTRGLYPEEIWELRIVDRDPQVRIFGRFAGVDCFIALTLEERPGLDFGAAMVECEAAWSDLFGDIGPWKGKGTFPHGYLRYSKVVP